MRAVRHSLAALSALAAAPFAAGALALRPQWRTGLRERLGALPRQGESPIWIHAASVGEVSAALRLVDAFRRDEASVYTSTTTVTGRDVMRRMAPGVPCYLAPLDHLWCVEAALERVSPSALVLVETELWPTWIAAAQRRRVPVVLVSARISDRSFQRYLRVHPFTRRALRRLVGIGARTEADAERLVALGADPEKLVVTGDLKVEAADVSTLKPDIAAVLADTPLFVAGSTHDGEEEVALDVLAALERAGLECALAIAPRHLERVVDVAAAVRRRGRGVRLRTAIGDARLGPGEVLVVDTLGELSALYARALVAFVGGTLAPVGGHNVLEPVLAGAVALFGPCCENVRDAVAILEDCGAGQRVEDGAALERAVVAAVRDSAKTAVRGAEGRRALRVHRGSTARSVALIRRALAATDASAVTLSRRES